MWCTLIYCLLQCFFLIIPSITSCSRQKLTKATNNPKQNKTIIFGIFCVSIILNVLFRIQEKNKSPSSSWHCFLLLAFLCSYYSSPPTCSSHLFVWLCSQPLSHPRPSGHIYVPTTISSLCLVTVAPSASSGRKVEWKKWIENTEQMCLEQSVWLHLSSVTHVQENVCYTKAVDILWCDSKGNWYQGHTLDSVQLLIMVNQSHKCLAAKRQTCSTSSVVSFSTEEGTEFQYGKHTNMRKVNQCAPQCSHSNLMSHCDLSPLKRSPRTASSWYSC